LFFFVSPYDSTPKRHLQPACKTYRMYLTRCVDRLALKGSTLARDSNTVLPVYSGSQGKEEQRNNGYCKLQYDCDSIILLSNPPRRSTTLPRIKKWYMPVVYIENRHPSSSSYHTKYSEVTIIGGQEWVRFGNCLRGGDFHRQDRWNYYPLTLDKWITPLPGFQTLITYALEEGRGHILLERE
jgi:hypothetical protein